MTQKATFGAGCFWGVEARFRQVDGVTDAVVGYMGGHTKQPTYEEVCAGQTGHAEVVEVSFDPLQVSYTDLLEVFWTIHDPTQVNRQGPDIGRQYRSVIFCHDEEQRMTAEVSLRRLADSGRCQGTIATSIEPAGAFWRAEEYHQQYLARQNASCGI